jgi:CheY-like chemotaxis protein
LLLQDSAPFHVVLLDLDMPVMGGLQCSTTIRATVPETKQYVLAMQ